MLDQDDQRRLEQIARQLRVEDPVFAQGLSEGEPRRPRGDCRWPLLTLAAVGLTVLFTGLAVASILLAVGGAVTAGTALVSYRRRVLAAHGGLTRRRPRRGR